MDFKKYLKSEYRDYEVLWVENLNGSYLNKIKDNPDKKYIVTSGILKLFFDDNPNVLLYDPNMFIRIKLKTEDLKVEVDEELDNECLWRLIENKRPSTVVLNCKEIAPFTLHPELTYAEFFCNIYGLKFVRTSPVLKYIQDGIKHRNR